MQAISSTAIPIPLADIFSPEAILVGLRQRTKQGAVEELVNHLVTLGHLAPDAEKTMVESILAREKLGSTALGNGIAFPHCRSSLTAKFVGALGLTPHGVPFDALDAEPVYSIFLLLAPLDGREQHYEILGRITAIGRDKGCRYQLRGCRTAEAAHYFLQEQDRR
jgi:PTS system nitrogen regulatory IIA component